MADVSDAGPAKRPRSASPNHAATPFPEKGEDTTEFLPDRGLLLRHGTTLALMALVADWLNASEEFEQVDPSADWEKWASRGQDLSLYYAALIDPAEDGLFPRAAPRWAFTPTIHPSSFVCD